MACVLLHYLCVFVLYIPLHKLKEGVKTHFIGISTVYVCHAWVSTDDLYQFPWTLWVCLAIHPERPNTLQGTSEL